MSKLLQSIICCVLVCVCLPAFGQVEHEQHIVNAPFDESRLLKLSDINLPAKLCQRNGVETDELQKACDEARIELVQTFIELISNESGQRQASLEAEASFHTKTREHALQALMQQTWKGEIIFWTSLGLVALGVVAAAFQFRAAWRVQDENKSNIEIVISEKEIALKTTWIGVILLAMSMCFFALYLYFVYEIEDLSIP